MNHRKFQSVAIARSYTIAPGIGGTAFPILVMIVVAFAFAFAIAQLPAWSKAYFPTAKEMIQRADCIALVTIEKCEAKESSQRETGYGYRQQSIALVKSVIKGQLSKRIIILGAETFKCAQCSFPPGDSIVFLTRNGDAYSGSAWGISNLPVRNGKIAWFKDLGSRQSDVQEEVKKVVDQIKSEMNAQQPVR